MRDLCPTLTVGDFDKGRLNNESLPKLLVGRTDVEKLEWRRGFANTYEEQRRGGQRMPDKDNFNAVVEDVEYIVRRLTPTECARLQGMPDWWAEDIAIENPTEEDIDRWAEVFETHDRALGLNKKPKSRKQIRKWLQNVGNSDGDKYKMWGNGIALPCALYVLEGIAEFEGERSRRNGF